MSTIKKVGLVLAPGEAALSSTALLPPLTLGVLGAHLRAHGLMVDAYDLNLDLNDLAHQVDRQTFRVLYDKGSVRRFLTGEDDPAIRSFIESLLAGKDLSQYDIVGISCGADFSWMEIHSAFLIGEHLQRTYGIPVVFGGNNVDYLVQFRDTFRELWSLVLRKERFFVVVGPGEETLHGIIQWLNHDGDRPLNELPGLVRLEQDRVVYNAWQKPLLVKPDFQGLHLDRYFNYIQDSCHGNQVDEDVERQNLVQIYKWPSHIAQFANQANAQQAGNGMVGRLMLPHLFNYNCPFRCAFCVQSDEQRRSLTFGKAAQVVNDIAELMQEYETSYFCFLNNAFNYSRQFVKEFCALVQERGLKFYWSDSGRFDNLDLDLLRMMRDAGCKKLTFGLETASPKLLEVIGRKIDPRQARQVLEWCHELGIWADVNVIVGLPHETEEDFQITYQFMRENRELINNFLLNAYFIIPDSLIGRHPEQYKIQILKDSKAYERILMANYRWITSDEVLAGRPLNFAVYRFNEIGGRGYEEIAQANKRKVALMRVEWERQNADHEHFSKALHMFAGLRTSQPPGRTVVTETGKGW